MDSENDKNFEPKEASGLPNQEDYHDPNEVTLDDFLTKLLLRKKKLQKFFLFRGTTIPVQGKRRRTQLRTSTIGVRFCSIGFGVSSIKSGHCL